MKTYIPIDDNEKGGADFSLVVIGDMGKPACKDHGAMNKISEYPPGYWRCITLSGLGQDYKGKKTTPDGNRPNPCRAACREA
jgi:hypothetical protein